ncbi:MAG TPA: head GIN domain-containing protein [Acidobacteriota bacterium]|nr:head GIN domain-containing protein [Acidobacteriota bacterium]
MKKRIPLLLPLFALALSGCEIIDEGLRAERVRGSGKVIQEKRDVRGFSGVKLASVGDLSIRQGNQESLTVEAEDNILPLIKTEVEGGTLTIRTERGVSLSPTVPVRYTLVVKELGDVELSGSGNIRTEAIKSQDFRVRLSGSGGVRLGELTANTLTSEISGSGHVEVPGKVASQKVHISGSGDYDGSNLHSQSADISVSGSGDSKVWVEDELVVHVSGSGSVDYYGNPKVSQHTSGSGRIHNLGNRP